jgi:hypothetical protein
VIDYVDANLPFREKLSAEFRRANFALRGLLPIEAGIPQWQRIPLQIERIEYASPGFQDLTGAGKVFGEFRKMVDRLIFLGKDYRKKEIENELLEQELLGRKIDNVSKVIEVCTKMGMSNGEIRQVILNIDENTNSIIRLGANSKLTPLSPRERTSRRASEGE